MNDNSSLSLSLSEKLGIPSGEIKIFYFLRETNDSSLKAKGYVDLIIFLTSKSTDTEKIVEIAHEIFEPFHPDYLSSGLASVYSQSYDQDFTHVERAHKVSLPQEMRPTEDERIFSIAGAFPAALFHHLTGSQALEA